MTGKHRSAGELAAQLGGLYRQYGYRKFKMSKFEEYDLYAEFKSFLRSDSIITFNDPTGRLLALKPDVTLSIVKNSRGGAVPEKVYYNESVYRVSPGAREFKELTQVGLECVGEIDLYALGEVLTLAASSLSAISEDWVLDLSHMGFAAALLKAAGLTPLQEGELLACLARKSAHDLAALCGEWGVPEAASAPLTALAALSGTFEDTARAARGLTEDPDALSALEELERLYAILLLLFPPEKLRLDFSIVNDMRYYNGLTFQGYVAGVPGSVLSGGRYDPLLKKLGKGAGAVGFAVYLDQLELLDRREEAYDVDTLVLYETAADPLALSQAVRMLTQSGQSVLVRRDGAGGAPVKSRRTVRMKDRGLEIVE